MPIQYALKSALILGIAAVLIAPGVGAAPKKKELFGLFVPVAPQPIKSDRYCGNLSGALSSGEFFDGLQRLGAGRHIEFRRDAQPVTNFPPTIAVSLAGQITQCASDASGSAVRFVQPGNGSSQQAVSEFMNSLRFTAEWQDPQGVKPVSNWSVAKSLSSDKTSRLADQIPMRFAFQVPSQGVPLTNQLVISVYAPSGAKLATFTAGVLSRIPKHRLQTIHAQQSE